MYESLTLEGYIRMPLKVKFVSVQLSGVGFEHSSSQLEASAL